MPTEIVVQDDKEEQKVPSPRKDEKDEEPVETGPKQPEELVVKSELDQAVLNLSDDLKELLEGGVSPREIVPDYLD